MLHSEAWRRSQRVAFPRQRRKSTGETTRSLASDAMPTLLYSYSHAARRPSRKENGVLNCWSRPPSSPGRLRLMSHRSRWDMAGMDGYPCHLLSALIWWFVKLGMRTRYYEPLNRPFSLMQEPGCFPRQSRGRAQEREDTCSPQENDLCWSLLSIHVNY